MIDKMVLLMMTVFLLPPTDVVANNQMKISALFLLKLENEFKIGSTALDCIIEDITTLLNNKIDSCIIN